MEITDKHINFVLAFATFSCVFYFSDSVMLGIVGFLGALKGLKKGKEMQDTWREESVDPSKTSN